MKRIKPLPNPAVYYNYNESKYPDSIRVSFSDGHTEIYERQIKQPSPRRYLKMALHEKRNN